jgi:hypothetical protein
LEPSVSVHLRLCFSFKGFDKAIDLEEKQSPNSQQDLEEVRNTFCTSPFDMLIEPPTMASYEIHDRIV